jgi:TonB family protein
MRIWILLATVAFTLTCKNVVGQQVDWQRYRVDGGEFSVELPTVPSMTITTIYHGPTDRNRKERVLGAYADGVAYSILSFENPFKTSLDQFVKESTQRFGFGGDSTGSKDINVGGFAGRQRLLGDSSPVGAVQYFVTNTQVLRLVAVGAELSDKRLSRFFSSLRLGKNMEGAEVISGIGVILRPSADAIGPESERKTYKGKEVDQKIKLVSKPEPSYTEKARQERVKGTVVLKGCFTGWGEVDDISVVSGLPHGLTEQAILVARQIKFVPAKKDGKFVSMWIQLEYNFNLY